MEVDGCGYTHQWNSQLQALYSELAFANAVTVKYTYEPLLLLITLLLALMETRGFVH